MQRYEKKDALWLGYGWEWDNQHTQLLYEMTKRSKKEVLNFKRNENKKGAGWLHGLDPNEEEISQPLAHTAGHVLIVGTTGSGKTRLFDHLITQAILRKNEAVIIIDPKGDKELCENARRACHLSGDGSRFKYFHPAFPEKSVRIDPLRNFNRATELASRIAVLMASEQGNPFQAFGQMALNNVCQGLLTAGERPNLVKVRSYLEGGTDSLVARAVAGYCDKHVPNWEYLAAPYLAKASTIEKKAHALIRFYRDKVPNKSPDLEGLFSMFEHDREHFQKMIASLLPIMNMLTSGDLGPLLSPDSDDLDDERTITDAARIIRNNQVLYIGLDSLSDSMVGSAIGSIILSDLTAVAGDRYNYGCKENRVNLYVDETSEVVNLPLIQTLNKGRGAGYCATLATQTFADFASALGDENKARQVLGNLNNIISLRVTDAETQEYICKSLPKTRVKYVMQTQGTNSASASGDAHSGNIGERLMEEEVELIPPAMLGQLPDLEFFARLVDGRLIKGRIPILTEKPQGK
jgi:conjugal transfer pilus assembly protein TraD